MAIMLAVAGSASGARAEDANRAPGVAEATAQVVGCSCRYQGGRVPLGAVVCLQTPKGPVRARCDLVLNNPSWTLLAERCPVS